METCLNSQSKSKYKKGYKNIETNLSIQNRYKEKMTSKIIKAGFQQMQKQRSRALQSHTTISHLKNHTTSQSDQLKYLNMQTYYKTKMKTKK